MLTLGASILVDVVYGVYVIRFGRVSVAPYVGALYNHHTITKPSSDCKHKFIYSNSTHTTYSARKVWEYKTEQNDKQWDTRYYTEN